MAHGESTAFFSYCREDSDFALRLAEDLKAVGASVWLDQLDILPGERWDRAVKDALIKSPRMLVILSPASVHSTNVMDEVSFALEEKKTVVPILYRECTIPFRLRRVQYVDFRQTYERGLQQLLRVLAHGQAAEQDTSAALDVKNQSSFDVLRAGERRRSGPQEARYQPTEQAPVEQEQTNATEKEVQAEAAEHGKRAAQVERKSAEGERLERTILRRWLNTAWNSASSAFKQRPVIAGATIIIIGVSFGLIFHFRSLFPHRANTAASRYQKRPAANAASDTKAARTCGHS